MRVVASLTTMPDRYHKVIETLKSLHAQTYTLDVIYLTIPNRSRRLNLRYPSIPLEINSLCTLLRGEDYGPITKIVGALLEENDPDTVIITFDDDMVYDTTVVECLMENGADANIQDIDGLTSLHYACKNDIVEIAIFLIQKGADYNAKDSKGNTPLGYINRKDRERVEEAIEEKRNTFILK